ncbi:MAG TPA: YihY/virulence factor BrkB family protein [Sphingomicrobium sp.]|nr:YihY/virulence factor BrkB family protein [Sphingomicrobium sp.]
MATIAHRPDGARSVARNDEGGGAETPAQISAPEWKAIAIRTWKEGSKDNISIVAAGVAFYGLIAMVPLLGATVLTYGLIASPQTVLHNVQSLATSLPKDVAKLIGDQLLNVVKTSGGKKGVGLLIAIAVAMWGARNAAGSIVTALNIAYEEEEKRSFLQVTFLALAITAGGVLLAMAGAVVIGAMAQLENWLPALGPIGAIAGKALAYILLAGLASAVAATLYRYGPSRAKAKWTWITPGSMFFAVGWMILTLGFGFYVSHFGKYNVTYGSLGGVVVFVTWLYLSSFILLYGAEFNFEIERQADRRVCSAHPLVTVPNDKNEEVAESAGQTDEFVAPGDIDQVRNEHPFLVARATNCAGAIAGMPHVGTISAALSTLGLSLLRKPGQKRAGAVLLAGAVGISLLKRER